MLKVPVVPWVCPDLRVTSSLSLIDRYLVYTLILLPDNMFAPPSFPYGLKQKHPRNHAFAFAGDMEQKRGDMDGKHEIFVGRRRVKCRMGVSDVVRRL